jgi:hypothetical protein
MTKNHCELVSYIVLMVLARSSLFHIWIRCQGSIFGPLGLLYSVILTRSFSRGRPFDNLKFSVIMARVHVPSCLLRVSARRKLIRFRRGRTIPVSLLIAYVWIREPAFECNDDRRQRVPAFQCSLVDLIEVSSGHRSQRMYEKQAHPLFIGISYADS